MILLLFTGCSGSTSTVANSKEAEKSETVVENAGSEVTEIVEAEKPVMEAPEGSTAAEMNAFDASEKRYLVKTVTIYTPSLDGEKSSLDGEKSFLLGSNMTMTSSGIEFTYIIAILRVRQVTSIMNTN